MCSFLMDSYVAVPYHPAVFCLHNPVPINFFSLVDQQD